MIGDLERRLKRLQELLPKGYTTFNAAREPVIRSLVPALRWFNAACDLFSSDGRDEEKKLMRESLTASVGVDNGGGYLYQVIEVLARGPVETPKGDHSVIVN
jgi:hypothetical protein